VQLISLTLLVLAQTDVTVSSKVQLYADTDRTVVVSPHVTGTVTLPSKTSLSATYTEDVVSSASVDVRTTASPRIYDRRQEVDFGVGQIIGGFTLGASYMHARERDYLSNGGSFTLSRELFQKNTTVSLRGGFMSNIVGRADDPLYQAPMTDFSGDLALTQIFTPTTIAQLNVTVARTNGMIASPYRHVRVNITEPTSGNTLLLLMPEAEPSDRFRFAAALGVKQYIGSFLVLHGEYRIYRDSWQVLSHTVDARVILDFSPITLRFRYRFYTQGRAFFYEPIYDALKTYLSSDRELSAFTSHLFGLKVEWAPLRTEKSGAAFRFDAKCEGMYFNYPEFIRLPERWALIAQVGAAVDF
jgi:hypothetical protein